MATPVACPGARLCARRISNARRHQIRSSCSPPLGFALPPPFDSRILTSISHKRWVFGRFFGFVLAFLHSKTSSFLAFQNAKFFVCTRSVGSFRKNNIFLPFPHLFPLARSISFPCRVRLPALSFDNSNRLPRVGSRVKTKVRGVSSFFCSWDAIHLIRRAVVSAALLLRC